MFHWIEARTFCHATEEEDRVLAALRTVMQDVAPVRHPLVGHFGNPLVVFTARAKDATTQRAVWTRVVAALGKDEVLRGIEERLDDDGIYHLRLDKQKAYLGTIATTTTSDVIAFRAKLAAFPKKRENIVSALRTEAEAA